MPGKTPLSLTHTHIERKAKKKKKHFESYNYIHMLANWALRVLLPNYKRACTKDKLPKGNRTE